MADTKTLAFEIGTEEIPAFELQKATVAMEGLIAGALDDVNLNYDTVSIYSSPRRLIAIVDGLEAATQAKVERFRGPNVKIAFDAQGDPTKAAAGFARGKGVSVDQLERAEEDGVEYIFATVQTPSVSATELLPGVLRGVIESFCWRKSMRWARRREQFSRPVRWICAMLGADVVPVEFAGVNSAAYTMGHRVLAPGAHDVASADDLLDVVRAAYVVPSQDERAARIREGVDEIVASLGQGFTADLPQKTFTEVVNLSEYPTALMCEFDPAFLAVPEEIIVDAMLMHQRYFPIYKDGRLTNKFVIVTNGNPDFAANIIDGNQRVVAARLYDAKFFYDEDLKRPLEAYVEQLDEVVFQERLGSVREKTDRVGQLARHLALDAALDAAAQADVARAALLAKADLVTNAVVEFTSVQGIMGSYYAAAAGESARVAQAIADHYKPRFAGDDIPADVVGKIVAVADKLDTICGLFAIGQPPTGSSDPFALRRAALGIIAILTGPNSPSINLEAAIAQSLRIYGEGGLEFVAADVSSAVVEFFVTRAKVSLKDAGVPGDAVDAVLAAGIVEPAVIFERAHALDDARKGAPEVFENLAIAYARANNLRDESLGTQCDAALFSGCERELNDAVEQAQTAVMQALGAGEYPVAIEALAALRAPVDEFFETTMIMDQDEKIRTNRLMLLNRFVGVFAQVADFSQLVKGKA